MDYLGEILKRCKCGIHITVNEHRDYYESVEQHLENLESFGDLEIPPDVRQKMIGLNTVVQVQFYPDTPIGFYRIFHYDLPTALRLSAELLERIKEKCAHYV